MTNRFTIKPEIAEKLGLQINKGNRYRITEQQRVALAALTDHPALQAEAEAVGLPINNVRQYWYKGKNFSIQVSNNKAPVDFEHIIDDLTDRIKKHSPKYKSVSRKPIADPHLLIIDAADTHFGKLASAYETGEDYNIAIAKQRVIEGFNGILAKSQAFNIEKIVVVVGNDVLHFDNAKSTTTSGTFQDSDVMFYDMFNIALETFVGLIESIVSDYDVDIVFNPSNHDYASGWMFARTLETWFRNTVNVNVVSDIRHRKYYQYGLNMIGLSHGDGAKMADMPLLMANESPQMWADTKFRYIYLHHIHHKQVTKFQSGKDYIGVTVEYLRSPSSADSWHSRNGYCGSKKAIEGFIHSKEHGQVARLSHYY
jgi:hypothetical protein